MRITINIGLNNNPLTPKTVILLLSQSTTIIDYKVCNGTYNGYKSPTLVVDLEILVYPEKWIEELCEIMTQECIPYASRDIGVLVYNKSFKGEKYDFDSKYFIKI